MSLSGGMTRHCGDIPIMNVCKGVIKVDEADMGRMFIVIVRGTSCILRYSMVCE